MQYSWEREDGKSDEGDVCHIFEKTPRDQVPFNNTPIELCIAHPTPFQFAISESQHSEVVSHCQRFVNNLTVAPPSPRRSCCFL
jgi:hypothetical protein